ncbi:MAG: elongation factor Ts [Dehalococcoidia bacterium]|nr:elongation factor Ts [Dehalococcoidia bacterium]MDZ4246808.1 elongation factor Ts [Dehalococcoidia bacterium]
MECRNALSEVVGDIEKAEAILKKKGLARAEKKAGRTTVQGIVEAYIHPGGKVGALIELNSETDFVARTDEFKELAHELAMQVAAQCPKYVSEEDIPQGTDAKPGEDCLLSQPYIRDPGKTIKDLINETIARTGENIQVRRFAKFTIGE